jgi:hypothetical protein
MTQKEKPQMTVGIYASLMVALKKDKEHAERELYTSNGHPYWQDVLKEIDTAIQYVKDTL